MSRWNRRRSLFAETPAAAPPKKRRWMHKLWVALKRICMVLGAMVLISSLFSCAVVSTLMRDSARPAAMPDQIVLHMPLTAAYPEHHIVSYSTAPPTLRAVIDALDAARTDRRVKGLVATLQGGSYGLAQLYELRAAIKRFRDSGKFAYFYVPSFDEQGQGLGSYYLAAAFGEIWMQPVGALSITGVKAEVPFARDLLAKIGVTPDFFARKEYKDVFASFTRTEMSEHAREAMTMLVGDIALQLRGDIAADRGMEPMVLQQHIDKGLLLDTEAKEAGLIDVIDYGDRLTEKIKQEVTGSADNDDAIFVDISHYVRQRARDRGERRVSASKKPRVALVYAVGTIISESQASAAAGPQAFLGDSLISARDLGMTFNDIIKDDDIKVVVVRVDSPGGSPVASETLRGKIVRAQEKGKTVIVSMGEAAASGGYWMVTPADYIFATPLTMTGSIGVAGGKFVLADLWQKIGVNWDGVDWGENAGMRSVNQMFTESGRARYNALMDSVYDGFVTRVAEGRKMTPEQAEPLARGRVWTGIQAQRRGLVDQLGGLDAALDYAAQQAGAQDRTGITLTIVPKPESPFARLARMLEMHSSIGRWYAALAGTAYAVRNADDFVVYDNLRVR